VQTHTTLLVILVPVKVISKAYKSVSYMNYNSKSHPCGIDDIFRNFAQISISKKELASLKP